MLSLRVALTALGYPNAVAHMRPVAWASVGGRVAAHPHVQVDGWPLIVPVIRTRWGTTGPLTEA